MSNLANSPAFPASVSIANNPGEWARCDSHPGMTFRQYAAVHILAGMTGSESWRRDEVSKAAVTAADSLIAALEKENTP
jgi:hypothetical protein